MAAIVLASAPYHALALSAGVTGKTNLGGGCASCHGTSPDASITVTITGPATLLAGQQGVYTVTAIKTGLANGMKMGVDVAASDGSFSVIAGQAMLVSPGEIIHSTSAGALATTSGGTAGYTFNYTMPIDAPGASTHTLYSVSHLQTSTMVAPSPGWNYGTNFTITVPASAPTPPTAVVATPGNTQASIAFALSASNGGSAITGYTVTASPPAGTPVTGAMSPITVIGLTNGTAYTFSVKANNAIGSSAGVVSNAVTPGPPPGAPINLIATAGDTQATLAFTAPNDGGNPVTAYQALCQPGSVMPPATNASPIIVTGLMNYTPYTCSVSATNIVGTGPAASVMVTPIYTGDMVPAITSAASATFSIFGGLDTFTVTKTGNPPPTLSLAGTLPSGVTFTPATGVLAGFPDTGTAGDYPLIFTAANGVPPNAVQNFTLTVPRISQTISYTKLKGAFAGSAISLTATASSALLVAFTSLTPSTCSVTGSSGQGLTRGVCTIAADQAGDSGTYLPATRVTHSVFVTNDRANVTVGSSPRSMALNPITNKIYVANYLGNSVTVIDGATLSTSTIAVGTNPDAIAVNPVTNKIYVLNVISNNVTVIDGATGATTTVAAGTRPDFLAINTVTNKIYVANVFGNDVTVIDGATNATTSVVVGAYPAGIALNPVTNKIYVSLTTNQVAVIDGATNMVTAVPVTGAAEQVAINAITNKVYALSFSTKTLTVIDGATLTTTPVALSNFQSSMAINPVTDTVYISGGGSAGRVDIVQGSALVNTLQIGFGIFAIAINPLTNHIYVSHPFDGAISVLDGADLSHASMFSGGADAIAINLATNRIYAVDADTNLMAVHDGMGLRTSTLALGGFSVPAAVAVNPVSNKAYIVTRGNGMTVIDGNGTTAHIPSGAQWGAVAVNPVTNRVFVGNESFGFVQVFDGVTNAFLTDYSLLGKENVVIAVNPITDVAWAAGNALGSVGYVKKMDAGTGATADLMVPPIGAISINTVTNKIYVTHPNNAAVSIINGVTNAIVTATVGGMPSGIAVNSVTNRIYVANSASGTVSVIDGVTNAVTTINSGGNPAGIAVNPLTNKIFVPGANGGITVVDGATNAITGASFAGTPGAIAVNLASNKVYVAQPVNGTVTVVDPVTLKATPIGVGQYPISLAVNPVNSRVYVANNQSDDVSIIEERIEQTIPLAATVSPIAGNNSSVTSISVGLQGSSSFSPTAPVVRAMYYQLDTTNGPWIKATGSAPNFTASLSGLAFGTHTLYAFASDGHEAASGDNMRHHAPVNSRVAAYSFTVAPFTFALTGAKSRKSHGVNSVFDIPVIPNTPITGPLNIEPRAIGSGHRIVFQFNGAITSPGNATVTDAGMNAIGNASVTNTSSDVIVTLTNIPDNRRALVTLTNVNGSGIGGSAALGFLVGDFNNTRSVNASDISAVKSRTGVNANSGNFRYDVNLSGAIDGADIGAVKARAGQLIP